MRNLIKKTLLISSLLISTNYANLDFSKGADFDDVILGLAPAVPAIEGEVHSPRERAETETSSRADLYKKYSTKRLERQARLIQEVAGTSTVFDVSNTEDLKTDGTYLFLTMEQLKENATKVQSILKNLPIFT